MLVIGAAALMQLQSAIVAATHGLSKLEGTRAQFGTIPPAALKQAALIALQIAASETIWPGDETLNIPMPEQQSYGPFQIGRR